MNTTNSSNLLDLVNSYEYIDRARLEDDRSSRRNVARARSIELSRLDPDQLPLLSPGLTGLELTLRKHMGASNTRLPQVPETPDKSGSPRQILFKIATDQTRS
ncbi:MAG: hypothetical protein ACERKX_12665 [Anaerolineales bacterium]